MICFLDAYAQQSIASIPHVWQTLHTVRTLIWDGIECRAPFLDPISHHTALPKMSNIEMVVLAGPAASFTRLGMADVWCWTESKTNFSASIMLNFSPQFVIVDFMRPPWFLGLLDSHSAEIPGSLLKDI